MRARRLASLIAVTLFTLGCSSTATSHEAPVPEQYASIPLYSEDSGMTAPLVVRRTNPVMSDTVRARHYRKAIVEAVIDEMGRVVDVYYVSGDPVWGEAVAQAVRRWEFEPATLQGEPITTRFRITSNFSRN